jgi:streptogramin lyase
MLATVLFTDIVGSTEKAAQVGDKQWRHLVSAHHALVRRQLKRHNGREIDTAGDGFFATFDQPAEAIRCAQGIVEDVRRLGIEVRAGIHMGEVEITGPKVAGIAVHIGARVMSKAGPSQILVSSTVRDLMAGSELRFDDLGTHELKGVPAQWHLYAAESPAPKIDDGSPIVVVEEPARRSKVPWLAAFIVVGVVLVLVIPPIFVKGGGGAPPFVVGPNTVVRIDPSSGKVAGGAHVGTNPGDIEADGDTLWVANFDDRTLQSIDASTGEAGRAFGGLPGNPSVIAVGGGFVWVGIFQGGVVRIDPTQNNASTPVDVGTGVGGIAVGLDAVWVTDSQRDALVKIDPTSASVIATFPLEEGASPLGVAVGAGSVWVAESLKGAVVRVNPDTGVVEKTIPLLEGDPTDVAFGQDYAWVTNFSDDSVTRIDPEDNLPTSIPNVGNGPSGIWAGPEGIWVATSLDGSVAEIRGTGVVQRVAIGNFAVEGVAVSAGSVWATVHTR